MTTITTGGPTADDPAVDDPTTDDPAVEDPATGGPAVELPAETSAGSPPRWIRPAFFALLAASAVLFLWNLSATGYGNEYYAAAVQAGTESWKAWFFGSLDAGNSITVDKPPASLWAMVLSTRIFGFSSWSMLIPQALMGVGSVALLYATVKRWSGPVAGLLAAAAFALTPVVALMFRYNNPDALLTLLLIAGAYCTVRAVEKASVRWLMLAGVAIGFGFLTKMLQAFLVLPAFALVYVLAAPTSIGRRLAHLAAATGAIVVSAGWWIAIVALWPAGSRPYIGGSETNSALELTFGYNGLGRIFGGDGNPGSGGMVGSPPSGAELPAGATFTGAGGAGGFGGSTGLTRMFDSFGGEISWLLPAALIGLIAGLWLTRRAPRTDRTRAALLLWGGWLLVTALVFSFMQGIVHEYYAVALAPGVAAVVAIASRELWQRRDHPAARLTMAIMLAGTVIWSFVLLNRVPDWLPALRWIVLIPGLLAAIALAAGVHRWRHTVAALLVTALLTGIGGTAAYAVATTSTDHSGGIVRSGPASAAQGGMPGGILLGPAPEGAALPPGMTPPNDTTPGNGTAPPNGTLPGYGTPPGDGTTSPEGRPGGGPLRQFGGPRNAATTNPDLVKSLQASTQTWAAATMSAQSAAGLQLASRKPIMAIGGFSGGDPSPTLAQFQQYVSENKIHYFISEGDGMHRIGGPNSTATTTNEIPTWVQSHFTSTTIGGQTVYDLTKPKS